MPDIAEVTATKRVFTEAAAPATPATGFVNVYALANGLLYSEDDLGAISALSLATGTSFPGTPSTGDRFRRSDIDYLVFFYDGTRWLSEQLYSVTFDHSDGMTASGNLYQGSLPELDGSTALWLVDWFTSTYVVTTNDGSNYWTITLKRWDGGTQTAIDDFATSVHAADVFVGTRHAQNVELASTNDAIASTIVKTGSPLAFYGSSSLTYRRIAT